MRLRPRSMRAKVLAVTAAVVILPQLIVIAASFHERDVGGRMRKHTEEAAQQVADLVQGSAGADPRVTGARVDRVAEQWAVRIRVVTGDGTSILDHDHEAGSGLLQHLGDIFFGPDGAPALSAFDASLPPVHLRPESEGALRGQPNSGCRHTPGRKLLVCHTAMRVVSAADGSDLLVYSQESSRRAIRALYDLRYQLLKLTLVMVPFGIALSLWLGWRLVRPVELLRREVLKRAREGAPRADIAVDRDDEVGDLALAFNSLLNALAERNRTNEAFLADLAHEFKNPVAALRASAERLQDADTVDPERAQRLASVMLRSCSRLDTLVTEFLELARAEAGLPNEERVPVRIDALVAGLVEVLGNDARFADVEVSVEIAEQTMEVSGVATRLESALRNLLDNAASFAGASGRVEVRARAAGDWVSVSIGDSGPGIAPEHVERVFERFYTTRGERRGTGLGLALTKAIVEAHGGEISVRSNPQGGAEFTVRLPFTSGSQPLQ